MVSSSGSCSPRILSVRIGEVSGLVQQEHSRVVESIVETGCRVYRRTCGARKPGWDADGQGQLKSGIRFGYGKASK